MQKKNNFVFIILQIIAWIIFVGLCIESGALLTNFGFSIYKPEMVSHLYQKLDMSDMYNKSWWTFYSMYSFILFISILKAAMFYVVIQLLMKLDSTNHLACMWQIKSCSLVTMLYPLESLVI